MSIVRQPLARLVLTVASCVPPVGRESHVSVASVQFQPTR